jgi:uncharacterized membrane protein (DUF4010 family)
MDAIVWTGQLRFVVALALGFLIGLERERTGTARGTRTFAGVRTYSIISMFGFGCAWLHQSGSQIMLPIGLAATVSLAVAGYLAKLKEGRTGWTSEISALMTFVVGALTVMTDIWVPMTLGIINTILLSEKSELENFVEKLDTTEFLAVLRFLLVTLIILPALPNQEFTQYRLNPTRIWQIVIMVSTIGFIGYILVKRFGDRIGLWLSGLLGGIVSSTAVAIASGRMAQQHSDRASSALQSAVLASSIMYLRILVLVWILNPAFLALLWWKLVVLFLIGIGLSFGAEHHDAEHMDAAQANLQNPFEIKPALVFAAVFVVLSILTDVVLKFFGQQGILLLAAAIGVTDIDPFILSIVQGAQPVAAYTVSALIIAMMSNTIMKGIYFWYLARDVRSRTAWRFALWAVCHVPLILFG